jgi:hypothetical protein
MMNVSRTTLTLVALALLAPAGLVTPGTPAAARAAAAGGEQSQQRAPDLGPCQDIKAPEGHKVSSRLYARGVQVYRWTGAGWAFVGPDAVLYADKGGRGVVGIHYGGPTWESNSGSTVMGAVEERCTPDPDSIPWLLLKATSSNGPGIFHRVTYIQRVNTIGGIAPAYPGEFPGEEVGVPYTTEYVFYRSHPGGDAERQ